MEIKDYHLKIIDDLFKNVHHPIYTEIENTFVELYWAIEDETANSYNHVYDQIVSIGEILSTKIVSSYLNSINICNKWIDARGLIQTDNNYRDANVDFKLTETCIRKEISKIFVKLVK